MTQDRVAARFGFAIKKAYRREEGKPDVGALRGFEQDVWSREELQSKCIAQISLSHVEAVAVLREAEIGATESCLQHCDNKVNI